MSVAGAVFIAMAAALLGAACAAADGALLALDDEPPSADSAANDRRGERERVHRALSIGRLLMQLAAGAAAAVALRLWTLPPTVAVPLTVAIALVVALTVEMVPRTVSEGYGASAGRRLRPVAQTVSRLFGWLVSASSAIERVIGHLLPVEVPQQTESGGAVEPLRPTAPAGRGHPVDRGVFVRRVMALSQTEVRTVMMPRVDITGLEKSTPWSEVLDRVRSSEHARLPVYEDTIDNVIGILLAKDLLHAAVADEPPPSGWLRFVRPAVFIPESKTIDAQLRDFEAAEAHIAIVVDEYGGTAGLITIEDILEEIVGDIRDEHDDEEESPIESEDGCRFWVAGRVSLEDLSEVLQHRIERADVTTVGGLIYDVLGRVPRAGETLNIDGFRVVVERVVRRRVQRVYFERVEALAEERS